jgi:uncharacterized protein (DUF433 family)
MAARYPLNLPADLKQEAAQLARQQGISLNQFFLWSISEKVAELKTSLDDPLHPLITYRRGSSGIPTPVLRGTGIRVETIVVAHQQWGQSVTELSGEYEVSPEMVEAALSYYHAHSAEINTLIRIEQELEPGYGEV